MTTLWAVSSWPSSDCMSGTLITTTYYQNLTCQTTGSTSQMVRPSDRFLQFKFLCCPGQDHWQHPLFRRLLRLELPTTQQRLERCLCMHVVLRYFVVITYVRFDSLQGGCYSGNQFIGSHADLFATITGYSDNMCKSKTWGPFFQPLGCDRTSSTTSFDVCVCVCVCVFVVLLDLCLRLITRYSKTTTF